MKRAIVFIAFAFLAAPAPAPALAQTATPGANDLVKLWLAQNNLTAGPTDYTTCIPPGGSDQICSWSAAVLGAQPTAAQLAALVATWQAQQTAAANAAAVQATYQSALAAGLAIVSTSTPALNGTYSVTASAQAAISSLVTGIAAGEGLPGGGAGFAFPDASGAAHTFTQAQFIAFAAAARNYVYALDLYSLGQGALPAASATIP